MKQPAKNRAVWKKLLKVEVIDSPFNRLKLGSETSMSWSKNTIKTKIEDEVIIESNCGNE